ncbi:hypothetical protein A0J61_07846 [Choanephora cucurbitarum]|uniref:Sacsin/Nov domain-containing protein n=1 Tax=Choanephora cucurbitarum TaxID=101091 RepID=A0A1C7N9S5_9FUNG|nr:hypothetical protein A0J61_07846 [Choanephora cucurbitarum]
MTTKADDRLELLRSNIMDTTGVEEKVEDDASSTSIEIHFQSNTLSDTSKPPDLSAKCDKIIFKNNGMAFRPEDWQRLKRIAEGNPDEQKIGAFGVGFYSLFSVCENPFVISGSQCMAFYFKGDQLFAKRADVPESEMDTWTSFLMDLREPMEMPNFEDFSRFLTTSMGFTANLRQMSVYFNQQQIFSLTKRVAEPRTMKIDTRQMILTTPQRMFTISGSDMRQIQLDSEKYTPPSLFTPFTHFLSSTKADKKSEKNSSGLPVDRASIFLRVVTASLQVNVSRDYEKEMERATKKKPPKTTKFQLVYTGKEELDASENRHQIFRDLIPFPHQGRVFIGFPTHQTTGCCCHMASRFIPTVERESIDFADRYISIWNKELLAVGGLLSRLVYNDEMEQIARLYRELVGQQTEVDKTVKEGADSAKAMLEKRGAHALHSFTFQQSTPSAVVSTVHEERFLSACKSPLDIITSHGVQPITLARLVPDSTSLTGHVITELLDTFVKTIPTITPIVFEECRESLNKLGKFNLISSLGLEDVLKELNTRSLKPDEMVACMKWWIECNKGNNRIPAQTRANINQDTRAQFLDAAIIDCGEEQGLLQLSHTKWWLNPKIIPLEMAIPNDTMPFAISKHFSTNDLAMYFGNMNELTVPHWLKFIVTEKAQLETSKEYAERVLMVVSKQFTHLSTKSQTDIVNLLKPKQCIPTRFGMKLPQESYFPSVNLFDDLPIIDFAHARNINDNFLSLLGIRRHVELQMVFDRLISDGSWSHVELIKYLTSVQSTLSDTEIRRLHGTAIFTKEGEAPRSREISKPSGQLTEDGKPIMETVTRNVYKRYRASELFAPIDIARQLQLPMIYWTTNPRWRSTSDEARFLERLGLNVKPPLATLLVLAAPAADMNTERKAAQHKALTYLIEHHQDYKDSYDVSKIQIKFLPCSDGKTYATPRECFTNPDVKLLGFQVLHPDLIAVRDKLGVRENPPADQLVKAFSDKRESDQEKARQLFEFMASRMGDFSRSHWQLLRQLAFIPVKDGQFMEPTQCYFESENSTTSFHKELFVFVSFGSLANSFLRSCGVKDEPTTIELASMLVKDPQRFWNLSSGGERYLNVLRQIAGQFYLIQSNRQLLSDMKSKPFLVGIKRSTISDQQHQDEGKEASNPMAADEEFVQYQLAKASDIFIIDDTMGHQIFSPLSAPMEPLLEDFYANLGSKMLSTQIREAYSYTSNIGVTPKTKQIAEMVFERTPIIIYQMMNDNPQRRKELLRDEKYVKQHLKVTQVKDLRITRTFKYTNEKNVQPTTSCADRSNFIIYLSDSNDIDYYDIANSLCSLIFARVRFNDAIVVERYLTASLYNLRRKGVPVDRILNIRKQEQRQQTTNLDKQKQAPLPHQPLPNPLSSKEMDAYTKQVQEVFGDCQEGYIRQLLAQQHEDHVQNVIQELLSKDYPKKQAQSGKEIGSSVVSEEEEREKKRQQAALAAKQQDTKRSSGFMNRLWSTWKAPANEPSAPSPPPPQLPPSTPQKDPNEDIKKLPKLPASDTTITPNFTNNIRQNLKRAIHSCKPYGGQDIFTPPRINQVNESTSYCDATPGQNLIHVGHVMGIEFYVHRTVNADDVLEQYGQAMARFKQILSQLSVVFGLPLKTIQIFYDKEGPTIAFNLSGSLFMNLRYFLALHDGADQGQEASKLKEALIYWFMTFCHELAHNFVSAHNSEHEFYMSSFAENYLEALMSHIYRDSNEPDANHKPTSLSSLD